MILSYREVNHKTKGWVCQRHKKAFLQSEKNELIFFLDLILRSRSTTVNCNNPMLSWSAYNTNLERNILIWLTLHSFLPQKNNSSENNT